MAQDAGRVRDDGAALLEGLRSDLQMDDEWVTTGDRSLTWWGTPLPMTFTADEPRLVQGDPTIRLAATIPLLVDVTATGADVLRTLDELNHLASVGAYVCRPADRRVDAVLTQYHYEAVEPVTHIFGGFALQLYTEVLGRVVPLAELLGADTAAVPHPTSGLRLDLDELLSFVEEVLVPAGTEPNRWQDEDFAGFAAFLTERGIADATADEHGVTAEFALPPSAPASYALLRLRCADHPTYGAGLLALLHVPIHAADPAFVAHELNLAEADLDTGYPMVGAWCSEDSGVAHTTFVPNYYGENWVLAQLALWASSRAYWAASTLVAG